MLYICEVAFLGNLLCCKLYYLLYSVLMESIPFGTLFLFYRDFKILKTDVYSSKTVL